MYRFHQGKCQKNRTGFVRLIIQIISSGLTRGLSQGEILAEEGPPANTQ